MRIHENRALCAKFLKFGIVLGMIIRIQESITNNFLAISVGPTIQDGRHKFWFLLILNP